MNWIDITDKDHKEAQSNEEGTQFRFRRKDGAWQIYTPAIIAKAEKIVEDMDELVEEAMDLAEEEVIKPAPKKKRKSPKK